MQRGDIATVVNANGKAVIPAGEALNLIERQRKLDSDEPHPLAVIIEQQQREGDRAEQATRRVMGLCWTSPRKVTVYRSCAALLCTA